MKFLELFDQMTGIVPVYHQIIFRIIMITLASSERRINSIFRKFSEVIAERCILKRFHNFINSGKIPLKTILTSISSPRHSRRFIIPKLNPVPDCLHPTPHYDSFAFADICRTIASELRTSLNFSRHYPEFISSVVNFITESLFAHTS